MHTGGDCAFEPSSSPGGNPKNVPTAFGLDNQRLARIALKVKPFCGFLLICDWLVCINVVSTGHLG